jgi:hypothetical protein
MLPVRYEYHLDIKSKAISVRPWRRMLPVRYEHHLDIKSKAISVTPWRRMLPVRYEHRLDIKSEAIPVTGRGFLQGCEMLRAPHCLDNRLTDGDKVASLTRRPLLYSPETLFLCFWYSFF